MRMQANLIPATNLWNKITEIFAGELSQASLTKLSKSQSESSRQKYASIKIATTKNNYVITSCENLVVNLPLQAISTQKNVPRPQFSVAPPRSWNRARQRHAFPAATDPRDPRNASTSKDGISKLTCEKPEKSRIISTRTGCLRNPTPMMSWLYIPYLSHLFLIHIGWNPVNLRFRSTFFFKHLPSQLTPEKKFTFRKISMPQKNVESSTIQQLRTYLTMPKVRFLKLQTSKSPGEQCRQYSQTLTSPPWWNTVLLEVVSWNLACWRMGFLFLIDVWDLWDISGRCDS